MVDAWWWWCNPFYHCLPLLLIKRRAEAWDHCDLRVASCQCQCGFLGSALRPLAWLSAAASILSLFSWEQNFPLLSEVIKVTVLFHPPFLFVSASDFDLVSVTHFPLLLLSGWWWGVVGLRALDVPCQYFCAMTSAAPQGDRAPESFPISEIKTAPHL